MVSGSDVFIFVSCALCCQFLWIVFLLLSSVFTNVYLLTPHFLLCPVSSHESERSCINVMDIEIPLLYDFSIWIWTCSYSVILFFFISLHFCSINMSVVSPSLTEIYICVIQMKKITLVYVLDITVLPRQLFQDNVWLIYYRRLIFQ